MRRAAVDSAELEYEVYGSGAPVLLIHGSHIADAFLPLISEPALQDRYELIHYHRRGFAGSSRTVGSFTIAEQAADCRALLQHLQVESAHVVGHSYGGTIGLQLALDAPDLVRSLALLEPALFMVPSAQAMFEQIGPVFALYQKGNKAGAVEAFMGAVAGPNYRPVLDQNVPGGIDQAVRDADTFFQVEMPAIQTWSFTEEDAKRITQPVLYVVSSESIPVMREGRDLMHRWLPQTEGFVLPDTTHLLQMQNPRGMAEALARFFARHPIPARIVSGA